MAFLSANSGVAGPQYQGVTQARYSHDTGNRMVQLNLAHLGRGIYVLKVTDVAGHFAALKIALD